MRRHLTIGVGALLLLVGVVLYSSAGTRDQAATSTTNPAASTTVTRSTSSVPSGPTAATMSAATGQPLETALAALQDAGFATIEAFDATGKRRTVDPAEPWYVVTQSVPAGLSVDKATRVVLFVVRSGEKPLQPDDLGFVKVPNVLYRTTGDAALTMTDLGARTVTFRDFSGGDRNVPADGSWVVTAQDPPGGTWIAMPLSATLDALPASEAPGG